MKHIGQTLKSHIETNHLKKRDIANAAGITYNYLSTVFNKPTIDCALFEKLCKAAGISTGEFFDDGGGSYKILSDIKQNTVIGSPTISVNDAENLRALLAEKERTIQILMAANGIAIGAKPEHNH